jgi:anaerobic ribonucleoside-triphosphate reductase activating protein
MRLALSRAHFPISTLGPGSRVGIWFQGCSIRCAGCISTDTWSGDKGSTTVEALMDSLAPWISKADGITVSGGEPFDQEDALHELLTRLRVATRADILVYSGYSWESLLHRLDRFHGLVDALISDPFLFEKPQTLALRGSDNQHLHCLSPLGESRFRSFERPLMADDHVLDLMMGDDGEVWMAGIPGRGDIQRLSAFLNLGGGSATSTEGKTAVGPQHRMGQE